MTDTDTKELKVSGSTSAKELAASIASMYREAPQRTITMVAVGHSATGQAVKAVPILNGYLASKGVIHVILPAFEDRVPHEGGKKITMTLLKLLKYNFGG